MSHDCMTPMNADSEPHPFFSIIVPCCQVARYVDDMVASVRRQSFADWECILSVEESSDTTEAKCRAVAAADARFRVIVGPKSGSPATPRNRDDQARCAELNRRRIARFESLCIPRKC